MKNHFKLYKAGKLWLTACITVLGIIGASSAYADDQQLTVTATTQSNVAAQVQNDVTREEENLQQKEE